VDWEIIVTFGIVWIFVLFLPEITFRLEITAIPFFLIAGMVLGPYGLGVVHGFEGLKFMGMLGLLFLIFLAGLDVHHAGKLRFKDSVMMATIIGCISFCGGFLLGIFAGYSPLSSALLGTVFQSSSVGEIIPIVNTNRRLREKFGILILPSLIIMDIVSLLMFSIFLNFKDNFLETLLITLEFIAFVAAIFIIIPRVGRYLDKKYFMASREFRVKILTMIVLAVSSVSLLLGMHPISVMFISGVLLGKYVDDSLYNKLEAIGHTFFIPIFFFVIGVETNFRLIFSAANYMLVISVVSVLVISKFMGGMLSSRILGIRGKDSIALGIIYIPQLSATLAATEVAYSLGFFDDSLRAAIVSMSIITVLSTPVILRLIYREREKVDMKDHVVILGGGVSGEYAASALYLMKVPFVVVDNDLKVVRRLREKGYTVIYGNAVHRNTLISAGIKNAKIALIMLPEAHECVVSARQIKAINPNVRIIARVQSQKEAEVIREYVDEVLVPEVITGMNIIWLLVREFKELSKE